MLPLRTHARAFHYRPPPSKKAVAKPSKVFLHKLNVERNTAFIRVGGSYDFLRSPAEAFALLRDVERRFGPIQEFHFNRDYDQNTRYQSLVFVSFKDPASYQRLPSESMEFAFKRPSSNPHQPGGIGLEDLKPFLEPQPLSEMADVSSRTAQLFLGWGGFHSLKPISTEADLQIENAFGLTSTDNFRMRCALRRYSEMISVPNPFEVVPGQEIETTLQEQEQEVPQVPDLESTPQDSTVSDDVQVQTQTPDVTTSKDTPTVHPPSSTPSTPTPSTLQQPDTTSPSTLESSLPSAQRKTSAKEPVATSASASTPPSASASPPPSASASPPPSTSPASPRPSTSPASSRPSASPASPRPSTSPASASPSASPTSSSLSTPAQPSTNLPQSVAQADAIATKMQKQAKSMNRAKNKKEERKKERDANPLPDLSKKKPAQKNPAQSSAKAGNKKARQTTNTKQKVVEEKPKTVREKISSFFSSFF
ncbi:hypothetical protein C0993_002352 [Termitomyces sp. T159_Od127]|nr:hypothetical protein C0993_002352 [Termitomyces sp. T159_Od127]